MKLLSDPLTDTKCRASSVLQKNVKVYGPRNALDIENDSTCWNSEGIEGSTQHFELDFKRAVRPQELRIQFQAGFIGQSCSVHVADSEGEFQSAQTVEFEDVHSIQTKPLSPPAGITKLRLVFDDFTDFYGRIIVYRLEVWGEDVSGDA